VTGVSAHAGLNATSDINVVRKVSEVVVADFPASPGDWDGEHVHPHVAFLDLNLNGINLGAGLGEFPSDVDFLATHVSCHRCFHFFWRGFATTDDWVLLASGLHVRGKSLLRGGVIDERSVHGYVDNPSVILLLGCLFLGHERNLLLSLNLDGTCCE